MFLWLIQILLFLVKTIYFQQSDEEIENLHKQISNLIEENDELKLAFEEKVRSRSRWLKKLTILQIYWI